MATVPVPVPPVEVPPVEEPPEEPPPPPQLMRETITTDSAKQKTAIPRTRLLFMIHLPFEKMPFKPS